jgi:hypothetical protein
VQKTLGGFVVLALSIAIPASIHASWFIWALWIGIGLASTLFLALSKPVKDRIPWRLQRKEYEPMVMRLIFRDLLRKDLQVAAQRLDNELKTPTVIELRTSADNVSKRLRDEGYDVSAKAAEVHLPDNASPVDVETRRSALHTQLWRLLLWDEYQ